MAQGAVSAGGRIIKGHRADAVDAVPEPQAQLGFPRVVFPGLHGNVQLLPLPDGPERHRALRQLFGPGQKILRAVYRRAVQRDDPISRADASRFRRTDGAGLCGDLRQSRHHDPVAPELNAHRLPHGDEQIPRRRRQSPSGSAGQHHCGDPRCDLSFFHAVSLSDRFCAFFAAL